jgi:hypothetical protein
MSAKKVPFMPYYMRFVLVMFILAGSLVFSTSHLAYAHTFSTSESVDFLSLVEQIRAETALVSMNLENNNITLAQTHAEKASSLLNNSTLDEIWEINTRIADSLETGLEQLEGNVTSLASTPQGQTPQDRIQSVNETVMTLDDLLAEAVTVRIESDQQNNATTWALVVADLVNTVLSDYGNATGSFDLTNMSNMAGMEGGMEEDMQMESSDNTTTTMTMSSGDEGQMQMSGGSSMGNDTTTMAMQTNSSGSASSTTNMTTTTNIVDQAAYQSAQYISNNTILQLFTETLKPLTLSANETSSSEAGNATTSSDSTAVMSPEEQSQTSTGNLTSSNIDELEARLMLLRDNVANKATPMEVMATAHLQIHPLLMQMYGLTMAPPQ